MQSVALLSDGATLRGSALWSFTLEWLRDKQQRERARSLLDSLLATMREDPLPRDGSRVSRTTSPQHLP